MSSPVSRRAATILSGLSSSGGAPSMPVIRTGMAWVEWTQAPPDVTLGLSYDPSICSRACLRQE
jgi:hypothetical protein